MSDTARQRFWLVAFLFLCCAGTLIAGRQVYELGDGLTLWDHDSEANVLREVDGFRAQGFWHDDGLGNALYGNRYPDYGFAAPKNREHTIGPDGVYTHYPPGPEYLLYGAEAVFGPAAIARLRLAPLLLGGVSAVFFGLCLRRRFGPMVGWLMMSACLCVPAFYDANAYLHFIGYAFALLLVELGIAVGRNRRLLPFLALGFAQGWLSFDWIFLVVLSPLALELALPLICPGDVARVRLALLRCACVGGGFVLAHALHLCQVWAHYGSLSQALNDLHAAARYRAGYEEVQGAAHYIGRACILLLFHLVSPYPVSVFFWRPDAGMPMTFRVFRFMGITLGLWLVVVTVVLAGVERWRRDHALASLRLVRRWAGVVGLGFVPSGMWWLLMQNHAYEHPYLQYRHLFFLFFLTVLFMATLVAPPLERLLGRWAGTSSRVHKARFMEASTP
jgi:hypothetical protein